MVKLKAVPFILMGTVVHLGLCMLVVQAEVECEDRINCVSPLTRIFEQILAFPLSLVRMLFHQNDTLANGFTIFYVIFNSLLAVAIVWFVLVWPFVRYAAKKNAA
jgi:hypothetical protein